MINGKVFWLPPSEMAFAESGTLPQWLEATFSRAPFLFGICVQQVVPKKLFEMIFRVAFSASKLDADSTNSLLEHAIFQRDYRFVCACLCTTHEAFLHSPWAYTL
jgi:hypothetical protein